MNRTIKRWMPAVVVPTVIAATAFGVSVSASAEVTLPAKSASQLLAFINTNPNIAFSGEVTKVANLGLPNINLIPAISQSTVNQMAKSLPKGMSDFVPKATVQDSLTTAIGFLAGTQQANVYVDGPSKVRVQVLDPMSERDYIRNGADLWAYDAGKQTVTHHALTAAEQAQLQAPRSISTDAAALPFDINSPASIADYFIKQATPTTDFAVGVAERVAGQAAYTLTLTPKTSGSLVSSVVIAIDGTNGLPLAVTVNAVGQSSPAFQVAFNSIDFATPAASIFAFTPPAGTTLSELAIPTWNGAQPDKSGQSDPADAPTAADQAQMNSLQQASWSAVLQIPASQTASVLSAIKGNTLYTDLTKPVTGGRIFSTALLNVLITDDGRVFAGAVTKDKLLEAAAK
jgi:outer membrane lipoprotein-sorting protein